MFGFVVWVVGSFLMLNEMQSKYIDDLIMECMRFLDGTRMRSSLRDKYVVLKVPAMDHPRGICSISEGSRDGSSLGHIYVVYVRVPVMDHPWGTYMLYT